MQKDFFHFTAGQFARLHHLNKRTLHYYDDIGLFSPACKGENGYRYYSCSQSADLENILALRELGMSIEEIKDYLKHPDSGGFQKLASQKIKDIDEQIGRLKKLKALLKGKQDSLARCKEAWDGKIEVVRRTEEYLLLTPLRTETSEPLDMERIMEHLQTAWEYSAYKSGCGSYISLDKVKEGRFDVYDGLFTPIPSASGTGALQRRPGGAYLCGYSVGNWDRLPGLYGRMLDFAEERGLKLTGCCYEMGLNEFAISSMEEYVTEIVIRCGGEESGS